MSINHLPTEEYEADFRARDISSSDANGVQILVEILLQEQRGQALTPLPESHWVDLMDELVPPSFSTPIVPLQSEQEMSFDSFSFIQ
jgi:hypothetical protein